jgi:hypothetical protein
VFEKHFVSSWWESLKAFLRCSEMWLLWLIQVLLGVDWIHRRNLCIPGSFVVESF